MRALDTTEKLINVPRMNHKERAQRAMEEKKGAPAPTITAGDAHNRSQSEALWQIALSLAAIADALENET